MRRPIIAITAAACALLCAAAARAQTSSGARRNPRQVSVSFGYEAHVDRLRYTFENPSSFSTDFLVRHTFTQSYAARNSWIVGTVGYSLRGDRFVTEVGATPERQASGSDFDTFDNPGNDVVVYGTNGDVRLRSFRVAQWSETTLFGLAWRFGYRFRRDRSQFLPTDRIVTHSSPRSEERSPTFGHETTISQVHELPVEISRDSALWDRWQLRLTGTISPLVWGWLVTILPDKYDRDIVFSAKAIALGGGVDVRRTISRWQLAVGIRGERTRSYAAARRIGLNVFHVTASIERRP